MGSWVSSSGLGFTDITAAEEMTDRALFRTFRPAFMPLCGALNVPSGSTAPVRRPLAGSAGEQTG